MHAHGRFSARKGVGAVHHRACKGAAALAHALPAPLQEVVRLPGGVAGARSEAHPGAAVMQLEQPAEIEGSDQHRRRQVVQIHLIQQERGNNTRQQCTRRFFKKDK